MTGLNNPNAVWGHKRGAGQIIWLGKTWQFESNARAIQAVHQMVRESIVPPEYPEWEWLYPLVLKEDKHYWACLFDWLGACFHPGKDRRTVCYVEYQLEIELQLFAQLPMPFFTEMRPVQKSRALEKLNRAKTVKLPGGRRRKAKVHKFKTGSVVGHVKTYRLPLCCVEMARLAPRKLIERNGAVNVRLVPATERQDSLEYIEYLSDTLPCVRR